MTAVMMTAGKIKQTPATIKPFQPARSWPQCMVISVEFGPGMRFVAPMRSRKWSGEIHFRFRTTSSSIIAMWTAGPPNPTQPSLKNTAATSRRDVSRVTARSSCGPMIIVKRYDNGCANIEQFIIVHSAPGSYRCNNVPNQKSNKSPRKDSRFFFL